MKLNELLNESTEEVYMVQIKDGGGFNVKADSMSAARTAAKGKLRPGQVIDKIVKDRQSSQNIEDKKAKLISYIESNRALQKEPSAQKNFKRRVSSATTSSKLQKISDEISAHGSPNKPEEKEEKED